MGVGAALKIMGDQARRAGLLRAKMPYIEPIVVVVISLADEGARFVGDGVVVPLRTLSDFLSNLPMYTSDVPRF